MFVRAGLLYAAWLILAEGRPDFLWLGIPVCLVLSYIGRRRARAGGKTIRAVGLFAYVPGFLWRSLLGGIDVASRVLRPAMPLRPGFVVHRFREDDDTVRVVFCDVVSLLPGTLVVGIEGRRALIHLLADDVQLRRMIEHEETRASHLYAAGIGREKRAGRLCREASEHAPDGERRCR